MKTIAIKTTNLERAKSLTNPIFESPLGSAYHCTPVKGIPATIVCGFLPQGLILTVANGRHNNSGYSELHAFASGCTDKEFLEGLAFLCSTILGDSRMVYSDYEPKEAADPGDMEISIDGQVLAWEWSQDDDQEDKWYRIPVPRAAIH